MSKIHIVFGPQGAGKSTYSKKLAQEVNGIHFAIDDWMWTLFGADLPKSMSPKWINERVGRCEKMIWELSKNITTCGREVILDLGFTKLAKRKKFKQLAAELNIPSQVHFIKAPHAIRRKRVLDRNVNKGDTFSFEVTPGMFDFMEGEYQQPWEDELKDAIIVDTNTST